MKRNDVLSCAAVSLLVALSSEGGAATVNPGPGEYVFSGTIYHSQSLFGIHCKITMTVDVSATSSGLHMEVVDGAYGSYDGSESSTLLCEAITMDFPWSASISNNDIGDTEDQPVNIQFQNVSVTGWMGLCGTGNDTMPAVLTSINPSTLPTRINYSAAVGNCSFSAELEEVSHTLSISNP
ncbi:hypothetical protein [Alloalcanivorax xenomutans]|uniref:hypothetical protein n=1 Tax=Alloalcanivorax xenomutans TaxID=1094342 RepID=UPI003BAA4A74